MTQDDGTAFYARESIATSLYDRLFAAPSIDGDLAFYDAFCGDAGSRILDAACGTGRVAKYLARPDRRIVAFDSSPFFVAGLRAELVRRPAAGPIAVGRDRLESFRLPDRFDRVIVAYYGFAHVLSAADRAAGFARLLGHLRPGGRLVIHVPRHDLLTRPVPEAELAGLSYEAALQPDGPLRLCQDVEAMTFDPARGVRSIRLRYRTLRDGRVTRDERLVLQYAAVTPDELADLARRHDARILRTLSGFRSGVDSETVVEIEKR
ncbi:hypothetical protein GCM10017083_05090 [Thalassobaculum fulvum]|uniref:Methyltransferase domain-containing protein n=1 Tax=Thalassobaculum fulvum TaxID=1633335 RepID=A0A918XNH0_9PROT|nr:class I SAM-dependent methyltransferase [Thalassobaculum fulvum]GHD41109.1 hypothetical protein GCM10017083_05090 [Thalassobaculum fulvum]